MSSNKVEPRGTVPSGPGESRVPRIEPNRGDRRGTVLPLRPRELRVPRKPGLQQTPRESRVPTPRAEKHRQRGAPDLPVFQRKPPEKPTGAPSPPVLQRTSSAHPDANKTAKRPLGQSRVPPFPTDANKAANRPHTQPSLPPTSNSTHILAHGVSLASPQGTDSQKPTFAPPDPPQHPGFALLLLPKVCRFRIQITSYCFFR